MLAAAPAERINFVGRQDLNFRPNRILPCLRASEEGNWAGHCLNVVFVDVSSLPMLCDVLNVMRPERMPRV